MRGARGRRGRIRRICASLEPIRLTLLGALCWRRQCEITDALVDLLIGLVHKVNATEERRVERTLTDDLTRVHGKQGILLRLAAAAVDQPDETVWRALFPVVGEGTLRDLVREAKATELAFRVQVQTVQRARTRATTGGCSAHWWPRCGFNQTTRRFGRRSTRSTCWPATHVDGKRRL